MGRGKEGKFFQFCLEHVKAYNATYNYFSGMNDEALAAYAKQEEIGHRPTWKLGVNSSAARMAQRGRGRERRRMEPDVAGWVQHVPWPCAPASRTRQAGIARRHRSRKKGAGNA
jgi:hypothetical protein